MEENIHNLEPSESFGTVPNPAEISAAIPQPSAEFRTLPKAAEGFGKVPHVAERRVNHTLTVKETARMFETAGVARTERSVINWCQPNRQGIARLDSYYDPNERKYYITTQSVETVIQEEILRAKKPSDAVDSEPFKNTVEHVKHFSPSDRQGSVDEKNVQEMEREILDLKIANRGKDYLIDQLRNERTGVLDKLLSATRTVGELETKMLQFAPKKIQ